jgi:hypothetical protein
MSTPQRSIRSGRLTYASGWFAAVTLVSALVGDVRALATTERTATQPMSPSRGVSGCGGSNLTLTGTMVIAL